MDKQDTEILQTIRYEFSRRQGRAIPEGLRKLALSALQRGHKANEIARAAGVSQQSLVNWKRREDVPATRTKPIPEPVELKVIESRPQVRLELDERGAVARITLCSGAIVELPARALDPRWLVALNGCAL